MFLLAPLSARFCRRPPLRRIAARGIGSALAIAAMSLPAGAGLAGMERLAAGLNRPVALAFPPGDDERMFILGKDGDLRLWRRSTGLVAPTPVLAVADVESAATESGLLGLAFHPDFAANGKFYIYATVDNGGTLIDGAASPFSSHVREYRLAPGSDVAEPGFATVATWLQPQVNHNGGWLGFGPDGSLYVASGDGGGGDDVGLGHTAGTGNAQDLTDNWLGKILRLDVNGDDFPDDPLRNYAVPPDNPFVGVEGDDEIWHYGLRNPWRASFDRATGDLWIGDVGQATREEIDFQGAGGGGLNFGWRLREGTVANPTAGIGGPAPVGAIEPVYDYLQTDDPDDPDPDDPFRGNAVLGGYLYRGPDPTLRGKYFFADTSVNRFWTFDPADPRGTVASVTAQLAPAAGLALLPATFGEDRYGNLYVAFVASGEVYRIKTDALVPGDFNASAAVDAVDLAAWLVGFGLEGDATVAHGDADADGDVDGADMLAWQRSLGDDALNAAGAVSSGLPTSEPTSLPCWAAACLAFRARVSTTDRLRLIARCRRYLTSNQ